MSESYRLTELRFGNIRIPIEADPLMPEDTIVISSEVADPKTGRRRRQILFVRNIREWTTDAMTAKRSKD